jgi:hypothetical protein
MLAPVSSIFPSFYTVFTEWPALKGVGRRE